MDLTRRNLLRSGAALGGLAGLGVEGLLGMPAAEAAANVTTLAGTYLRGRAGAGGYARLVRGAGESHVVRTGLGVAAKPGRKARRTGLLTFAQLSDVHVVDHQSPARVEWVDRFDDRDESSDPVPGLFAAAYRPHEMLTAQVADAMVRAINAAKVGPVTGKPIAFALQTGDNSDNSQYNEVRWNIDVLDGGVVRSDSGDLTRYEGVMDGDPAYYDGHYWHPDGTPSGKAADLARSRYGFPVVRGLLDAARRRFGAPGLDVPWYSAFGNHDQLVQGNFPHTLPLTAVATGDLKVISPPAGVSEADLLDVLRTGDPSALLPALAVSPTTKVVSADANRRTISRAEVIAEHFRTTGLPHGHGYTAANRASGHAYYAFDKGALRFIVLDTVNANGKDDGSLDQTQFAWLAAKLTAAKAANKIVVLASHHTIDTMTNSLVGTGGETETRVLGEEVLALVLQHPQVVAWVNGHTHMNQIWARRGAGGGFWEINTASHIDFPMQSRLLEVVDNHDGTLSIFTTMLDHSGPTSYAGRLDDPVSLAGLARELAVNDPQERTSHRRGARNARNVELLVGDPRG
jgi:metallophosphoesterase (TIGR03767 family)